VWCGYFRDGVDLAGLYEISRWNTYLQVRIYREGVRGGLRYLFLDGRGRRSWIQIMRRLNSIRTHSLHITIPFGVMNTLGVVIVFLALDVRARARLLVALIDLPDTKLGPRSVDLETFLTHAAWSRVNPSQSGNDDFLAPSLPSSTLCQHPPLARAMATSTYPLHVSSVLTPSMSVARKSHRRSPAYSPPPNKLGAYVALAPAP